MLKKYLALLLLGFILQVSGLSPYPDQPRDYDPPKSLPESSLFFSAEVSKLQKKWEKPIPEWMALQVAQELAAFKEKGISQEALDATYEHIQSFPAIAIHYGRIRVIGEKIFLLGNDEFMMSDFFRTIARQCDFPGIPDLPPIDIILNQSDGIPLSDDTENYWITPDFKNQAPVFTFAKSKNAPYTICTADRFTLRTWHNLSKVILQTNGFFPWKSKKPTAFWRGIPSDFDHKYWNHPSDEAFADYANKPRFIACHQSYYYPDLIDAGFNALQLCPPSIFDRLAPFAKPGVPQGSHLPYKYLPVLDGCMCTYPGYLWRLLSNSVCFKTENDTVQWFYSALKPYVHYIPINSDLADLIDKVLWAQHHDQQCNQISKNATKFILENVMPEDIYLYQLYLYREYAKLQTFTQEDLLKLTENDPRWIRIR